MVRWFALVIPSELWSQRVHASEGVAVEGVSEVVDLVNRTRDSASFFMVVEKFIEVSLYKPTKMRVEWVEAILFRRHQEREREL